MNPHTARRAAGAITVYALLTGAGCASPTSVQVFSPPPDPITQASRAPREVLKAMEGAADVCLLRAEDEKAAMAASAEVFRKGFHEPLDLAPERAREMPAWLAVYFGRSSSMPRLAAIERVERTGQTVRVRYHGPPPGVHGATGDLRHYAAWVPLGVLPDGEYAIELYESRRKEVTLMRRWRLDGAVWTSYLKTP